MGAARIERHDPVRERAALRALAQWATRFSPLVAIDEPDGLRLDVAGCAHLFGGEPRLRRTVERRLERLGIASRVAIAPTYGCAWGVARFAPPERRLVEPGGARDAIAPLPARALRLPESLVSDLDALGLHRVGDLLDLPRSAATARFGPELSSRLDQALGQAFELIDPVRREPPVARERLFQGPTTQTEAIEHAVRELLAETCRELSRRDAGAQLVSVELIRSDLPPLTIDLRVSRPARDPRRLWSLLAPKLERAHLGFGVEGVRVRAGDVGRVRHEQSSRWTSDERADREALRREAAELIDTLAARFGGDRVRRAALAESHRPERAVRWSSALEPEPPEAPPAPADRPTALLDRPVPADVLALTPDGPVHRVRFGGREHEIVRCVGPERLAPEWWRRAGSTRDYFAVATSEGRWLWVARSLETGRWFVHGIWA